MLHTHCTHRLEPLSAVGYRRGDCPTVFAFRVLVLVLLAFFVFFAHSLLTQPIMAVDFQPATVSPVAVTNGWMINRFVLNNLGTVVFSSGQTASSDGLVLVRPNQFIK